MKVAVFASTISALALLVACDPPAPEPTAGSATKDPAAAAAASSGSAAGSAAPKAKGPFPESTNPAMSDPSLAKDEAPASFKVKFETTAGDFSIECYREWAPNGVDRLYNLVKIGFFDDVGFFRVVQKPKPFVVQFGIHGNPQVMGKWREASLPADPPKQSNTRGMVTYAMAGSPDTRTTQLFINYGDNSGLDAMGFGAVCKVLDDGMTVVDKIHSGYGETPSKQQPMIQSQGNAFLRKAFPELDYIKTARLVEGETPAADTSASADAGGSAAPNASAAPVASAAPSAKAAPSSSAAAGAPKKK